MLWVHLVTSALGAACWRRAACADVLAQQVMGLPFMPTHPCHAHDARARQASAARRSRRRAARRAPRPRGMHRRARSPRPRCSARPARCSTAAPRSCWPWRTGCGPRRSVVGQFRLCVPLGFGACLLRQRRRFLGVDDPRGLLRPVCAEPVWACSLRHRAMERSCHPVCPDPHLGRPPRAQGWRLVELEGLPAGPALLLREALHRCRADPPPGAPLAGPGARRLRRLVWRHAAVGAGLSGQRAGHTGRTAKHTESGGCRERARVALGRAA